MTNLEIREFECSYGSFCEINFQYFLATSLIMDYFKSVCEVSFYMYVIYVRMSVLVIFVENEIKIKIIKY